MLIRDIMNHESVTIQSDASLQEAAKIIHETQSSDLMVISPDGHFAGVLSEGDLIRVVLPKFDEIMHSGESPSQAFKLFIKKGIHMQDDPIEPLVIKSPLVLQPTDQILKAASLMIKNMIRRLPVVHEDKLVGIISRGDICLAVLLGQEI